MMVMVMTMTPPKMYVSMGGSGGGGRQVATLFLGVVVLFGFFGDSATEHPPPSSLPGLKTGFWRVILSVGFGVLTGLIGAVLFACLVRVFVHYMNRICVLEGPVIFSLRISPKTLETALENESESLGSSPNGQYRRTVLDNGLTVVVKRVELADASSIDKSNRRSMGRRVQKELEVLTGLRHVNLISLRAHVFEPERNGVLLVYDYVVNGTLEDAMRRAREDGMGCQASDHCRGD